MLSKTFQLGLSHLETVALLTARSLLMLTRLHTFFSLYFGLISERLCDVASIRPLGVETVAIGFNQETDQLIVSNLMSSEGRRCVLI